MIESLTGELVSAAFIAIVSAAGGALWKSNIYPFIVETRERVKLHQNWKAELDFHPGTTPKETEDIKMSIIKLGQKISGELEFIRGNNVGKKYTITGRYHHAILTFHYYAVDTGSTSQGTATLTRERDGKLLKGYFAYYSPESSTGPKVDAVACVFDPI